MLSLFHRLVLRFMRCSLWFNAGSTVAFFLALLVFSVPTAWGFLISPAAAPVVMRFCADYGHDMAWLGLVLRVLQYVADRIAWKVSKLCQSS